MIVDSKASSSTIEQPADPIAATAVAPTKRKDYTNLRDRPFLVINTIQRPQKPSITRRKGWAEAQGNWKIFETPFVVDRVSNKIMRDATVIIDVTRSTCLKNRFDNANDVEVVHHYMGKYGEYVKQAMGVWLRKMAQKMATDPRFAERLVEKATADVHEAAGIDAFEVVADQKPADQPANEA